jgi:hypothetical protein
MPSDEGASWWVLRMGKDAATPADQGGMRRIYRPREERRADVFDYIEIFINEPAGTAITATGFTCFRAIVRF